MSYNVKFTDQDKADITVFDNTSNTDTSLVFPGRNTAGYGQIVAENFLHLLENFASASEPVSPIEGQLWYDSGEDVLKINDGLSWKAASGIYKSPTEPSLDSSKEGELWIDTTNQQLRIFNGSRWILVGPSQTSIDGLRYGPVIETVDDSDNNKRSIIIFYVSDIPVSIVSKDSFIPKITIPGFPEIRSGINVNSPQNVSQVNEFEGGSIPKLVGTATSAESLIVSGTSVSIPAAKFLRSDVTNITEKPFNVRDNSGVTIGVDQNFVLSVSSTTARIYNSAVGSSINFQINRGGIPDTILKIQDNKIGINNSNPLKELDVNGNAGFNGTIVISDVTDASDINNGSLKTSGGASIKKSLRVGTNVFLNTEGGSTQTRELRPEATEVYELGSSSKRWKNVYSKTITADTIVGTLAGNIAGNAQTATGLRTPTSFRLSGDVDSQEIRFDGQTRYNQDRDPGDFKKVFYTSLSANIIATKSEPPDGKSKKTDYVLIYRPTEVGSTVSGLLKQTRDNFMADLGIPMGAILPYAGVSSPPGFLLCDGSEVLKSQYPDLYNIIGDLYNGTTPLLGVNTFRLPDLRGRFALGRDNMDNAFTIPLPGGGFSDAGGGNANRVEDATADELGRGGGQSKRTLELANLPEHSHNLQNSAGVQFSVVRNDPATSPNAYPGNAGTSINQAQFLNDSGGIKKPNSGFAFGQPFDTINPYLTVNYIIRSGPAAFTVT